MICQNKRPNLDRHNKAGRNILTNPHSSSRMNVSCPFFDDISFKSGSFHFWEVFLGENCFLDIGFVITIPSRNIIKLLKVMYQTSKKFREISEQRGKG